MTEYAAKSLLERALEGDWAAFKTCKETAAHMLSLNRELPNGLRVFVALVLMNKIVEPRNPRRAKTWLRAYFFYNRAKTCERRFELPLTSNDASSQRESCCDAISLALANLGYHVSPRAIKEICVGSKQENVKMRAEFSELEKLRLASLKRNRIAQTLHRRAWHWDGDITGSSVMS